MPLKQKTFIPDWIGLCSVLHPRQHSIMWETGFTGQKTEPTVSKYWRKKLQRKTWSDKIHN